ncbi:MFS transporter [Aureimonas sp. AU4]|uniref:MFS transporter n=1 Tax=Aureimonas sp. AU4 TaxID=1638163 RepID=UPI000782543D|nr:MFS transporter [Aureimonas sp. AU4]
MTLSQTGAPTKVARPTPPHAPGEAPTGQRWRVLALLFGISVLNGVDRIALAVGLPVIGQEFQLSPAVQGIVLSSFFWTYCLFQVPGGWAVDRFGARRVLSLGAGLWGLFQALASLAVGGVSLILTRLGLGLFEAPMMPSASKFTAAWFPERERSRSITLIDAGAPIGSAIGGLVLAELIALFSSWRIAFFVVGAVTIAYAVFLYLRLRSRPDEDPRVNAAERALISARAQPEAIAEPVRHMSRRTFAAMIVGRIGWTMIFFGLATWGPNYLAQARGFDLKSMGYATFAIFMAGGLGAIVSGALADWLQRKLPRDWAFKILFGVSGLVVLGGLLLLPRVSDPVTAVVVLSVLVMFHFFGSLYWTIPAMLAPRERIGVVGGVMNFAGTSSGIAAPILIGFLVQWTGGFDAVLTYFAICAVVYLVGSLLIDFRERRVLP